MVSLPPLPRLVALSLLAALCSSPAVQAAPIPVRFAEGVARGFLNIRSLNGAKLAEGDVFQVPRSNGVEYRLIFRFADGSLHDETVVFSQQRVFTLLRYRLIQHGASFPTRLDVAFDRKTGQYTARVREAKDGPERNLGGHLELPPDVYNGMIAILLKNLPRGAGDTIHVVSFMPKPRLVQMHITPVGEAAVRVGDRLRQTSQYLVKPQLGGLYGFLASLTGKELPTLHYWILRGEAPAFVKFEGPFFMAGPVWRVGSSYRTDGHGDDAHAAARPRNRPR